jgi:hypothetical protein
LDLGWEICSGLELQKCQQRVVSLSGKVREIGAVEFLDYTPGRLLR